MESPKVIIDLSEYESLKEFRNKIETEHCFVFYHSYNILNKKTYFTKDEAIKEVYESISELKKDFEHTEQQLKESLALSNKQRLEILQSERLIKELSKKKRFWIF